MAKAKLLVFASGTADGGGSGFANLVQASRDGMRLKADIVGVVSNHPNGGVWRHAERLGVLFVYFPGPWTAERYQGIVRNSGSEFFVLSGWNKIVCGLDLKTRFNSRTVFNIHPSLLPDFKGSYGGNVHKAVIEAYKRGEVAFSGFSMHFVTQELDGGPVFFRCSTRVKPEDTPESLEARVKKMEHAYQPVITDLVVNRVITWDGVDPMTLMFPAWYKLNHSAT